MIKVIEKILKNISVFISYFLYTNVFLALLLLINIDIYKTDITKRILILLGIDIVYMIILFFVYRKEIIKDLKDFKVNYKNYIPKYLPIYLLGVIAMGVINIVLTKLTGANTSGNEEVIREYIDKYPLYMAFSTVIYAPFVEELIFRKSIRNMVKNKYVFIILSGLIFGILHISDYTNATEILFGIPYVIMGIDFAYIYYKTDNIFTTMSYHMMHNLILLVIQFIR